MNFLRIAQDVRMLGGVQGNGPTSVENPAGYEEALVQFVKDAWEDIQNLREDFRFMRNFWNDSTVPSQSDYGHDDVKSFKKNSVRIKVSEKWVYLREGDDDGLREQFANAEEGQPQYYSQITQGRIRLYPTPSEIYEIGATIFSVPEILETNSQVPTFPVAYHRLIVYQALEKLAVFLSSPELYSKYQESADTLRGQMYRTEVPEKRVKRKARFV